MFCNLAGDGHPNYAWTRTIPVFRCSDKPPRARAVGSVPPSRTCAGMAIGRASLAALLFGLFVVASVLLQKRGSIRGPTDSAASVLHNSLELAERQLVILKIRLETSSATSSRLMRENVRLREETGRLENLLAKLPSRRAASTVEAATTTAAVTTTTAPAKPAEPAKPLPSGYRTPSALSERLLESTEFNKEVPPTQRHAALCHATDHHACHAVCRSAHS